MPYIGRTLGQGTRSRFLYTATAGQTTFSGSDTQSNTLAYADNNGLDCFQNGVLLKGGGADYTATTGTSVVLTTGASVSDVIEILVYDVFAIADHVKKSGDAMTGALTNIDVNGTELVLDADGDTSITADTDDQIDFKVGGSDKAKLDANAQLQIGGQVGTLRLGNDSTYHADIEWEFSNNELAYTINNVGNHTFNINGSEVMRIETDGDMYLGGSFGSAIRGGHQGIQIDMGSGEGEALITRTYDTSSAHLVTRSAQAGSGTHYILYFEKSTSGNVGSITHNDSTTSFNTSSDYRLKENVVTDWDATSRLKQLKPSRFNFKLDKDTTVDGFLAHEVSNIVPEAVTGEKDATTKEVLYVKGDEIPEGKKVGDVKIPSQIQPQAIDQSKLVPLLTKALQEAVAKIETLEAKVTALESK